MKMLIEIDEATLSNMNQMKRWAIVAGLWMAALHANLIDHSVRDIHIRNS